MKLKNMVWIELLYFMSSCSAISENKSSELKNNNSKRSLENLISTEATSVDETPSYFLKNDKTRFGALEKFISDSFNPGIFESNVNENLVVILTKDSISQGYMIDDCGLVLTVAHAARDIKRKRDFDSRIYDMKGGVYSVKRTEIFDYFHDYAILVADTNKLQKTHSLNFLNTYERNCGALC